MVSAGCSFAGSGLHAWRSLWGGVPLYSRLGKTIPSLDKAKFVRSFEDQPLNRMGYGVWQLVSTWNG